MANLLLALSWALFYILHTTLASSKLKRFLKAKWSVAYKWYSLFYSVLSAVLFVGILLQALFLPVKAIFPPSQFGQYAGYMVATAGVIVMLKAIKEIPLMSFLGLKPKKDEESKPELVITGLYSQVRHPLYLGLLAIFLGYFLVSGTVGALIHLTCLILYLPVGIYFEEKNLIAVYESDYRKYQQTVPSIFPRIPKKRG